MLAVYQMELTKIFNTFHPLFFQFCNIIFIVQTLQNSFMTCLGCSIFCFKIMQDIPHTQSITAHFVSIGRANAFPGGSDFRRAFGSFVCGIQNAVSRKNQMRFLGNVQTFFQRMSACFQCFGLSLEQSRIKHYSIAYNIHLVSLKNSRRNGTEHIFLSFKFKCMSGIRASLKTGYYIITGSQHIDDLTFTFVAPL